MSHELSRVLKIQYRLMDMTGGTATIMAPIARELRNRGHEIEEIPQRNNPLPETAKDFDLVHIWNVYGGWPEIRKCAKRLVLTVHHIPLKHEKGYIDAIKRTEPDVIHVVDPWAVRQLGRYGIYNVALIPQAIDRRFRPEPLPEEFTIGFIGNKESGLKRFEVIEQAAQELGIRCVGIKNPPWVSDDIVEQAYKMMSCYVCASWEEGGPVPVLEALQMGRPVVTTPVGNAALFVHPGMNGEFFNGDLKTLCDAIDRVREGLEWYAKNAAATPVSDPTMVCQLYERVYLEVVG